jgi:hypothetical protein
MVVFIGICTLLIGLAAGFRWGRGPALDAQGRRELRALRASTPVSAEDRARYPYPSQQNPGDASAGFFL